MNLQLEPVALSRSDVESDGLIRHRAMVDRRELSVTYRVDAAEHERRQAAGLGAVTSSRVLAALLSLPAEGLGQVEPLLADVFDEPATTDMAQIIDDPDRIRWGTRLLTAPLEIIEIEVTARSWARGRERVHSLAGLGPRVVRVEGRLPKDELFTLAEASHYGIGIIVADQELVLPPGDYISNHWGVGRWRFAEILYGQFLELSH